MSGPVRLGLIGYGLGGGVLHAPTIQAVPRLRVDAVVTSRADAVHARFPEAAVEASAEAVFADPAIDAVVIATPHDTHAPLARAALLAGKHVVVDKPFTTDPAEAETLIALARERGCMLTVFHNRRWDGDFLTVRKVLASGRLGRIRLVEMHWDRFRPDLRESWKEDPAHGGGLLADLGSHLIDQTLRLFGAPEAVSADTVAQRADSRIDDYLDLTLHHGAMRVRLAGSTIVAAPRPRFALHGDRGSFVKYGVDPQEDQLRAGAATTDAGFGEEPTEHHGMLTFGDGSTERVRTDPGRWAEFYEGVAAAVIDGAPPPVDPADALQGLRLIELARESATEGRVLAV